MKKAAVLFLVFWMLAVFSVYLIIIYEDSSDQNYLVQINRIQNRIEKDKLTQLQGEKSSLDQVEGAEELNNEAAEIFSLDLSDFSSEELGKVVSIQIMALENLNQKLGDEFFINSGSANSHHLFRLSESGEYIFKYQLRTNESTGSKFFNLLILISAVFIIFYSTKRSSNIMRKTGNHCLLISF